MSATLKAYGIDQLSIAERILLAEEIWDSIPDEAFQLSDAHRQDLERRIAEHDANPTATSSWEEVKARVMGKA